MAAFATSGQMIAQPVGVFGGYEIETTEDSNCELLGAAPERNEGFEDTT
jgi:hypothetical protein